MINLTERFVEYARDTLDLEDELTSENALETCYDKWLDEWDDELDSTPRAYISGLAAAGSVDEYAEVCFEEGWDLDRSVVEALKDEKYRGFLEKYARDENPEIADACIDCLAALGGAGTDDCFLALVLSDGLSKRAFGVVYDYLCGTTPEIVDKALKVIYTLESAPEKQRILVEIMSCYPGRKDVFMWLQTLLYRADDVPYTAIMIGRYGDADGVNVLKQFANSVDLSYDEYVEVKNAIDELGGTFELDKDFSEDVTYKIIKGLPVEEGDGTASRAKDGVPRNLLDEFDDEQPQEDDDPRGDA